MKTGTDSSAANGPVFESPGDDAGVYECQGEGVTLTVGRRAGGGAELGAPPAGKGQALPGGSGSDEREAEEEDLE